MATPRGRKKKLSIKVISRNEEEYVRQKPMDKHAPSYRNYDPQLHPFEKQREYTRALNAVKLDKAFSKPFVRAFEGHTDMIKCLVRHPANITHVVSGSYNGEIIVWNLSTGSKELFVEGAHKGIVYDLSVSSDGEHFFTCGLQDIKLWKFSQPEQGEPVDRDTAVPISTYSIEGHMFTGMDHHRNESLFATCGDGVSIWDEERASPLFTFEDSDHSETGVTVKFNKVERNLLASTNRDRSFVIYDIRTRLATSRTVANVKQNDFAWNPMKPYIFIVGSEDCNVYTYDMRKLKHPKIRHTQHTQAVLGVAWSPVGNEFASASYDTSVALWEASNNRPRDLYTTRRMAAVHTVEWTGDSKYVLSASADSSIRLWKSVAHQRLRPESLKEKRNRSYKNKLKQRYAHVPQIREINNRVWQPKRIYSARQQHIEMDKKAERKRDRVEQHSKESKKPKNYDNPVRLNE